MVKFLDIKSITEKNSEEIHEAVRRVVDSGWYLQGVENKKFEEYREKIRNEEKIFEEDIKTIFEL